MTPIEFDEESGTLYRGTRSNYESYMCVDEGAVCYHTPDGNIFISLCDISGFLEFINDERIKPLLHEAQKVQKTIVLGTTIVAYYLYPDGNVIIIRGKDTDTGKYFQVSQLHENEVCALTTKIKAALADGTAREI